MSVTGHLPSAPGGRLLRERAAQDSLAPLYGRDAEQAALVHLVTRLAAGHAGVTVLHGVPGSGRSRLLRRGIAFARAVGVQVLTALGSASSAHTPYAYVAQLPPRTSAAGAARAAVPHEEQSVAGWCRCLLAAAHRPTLLALDDVQWADPASLDVIGGLLRRLGSAPLGVLMTVTGTRGEFPDHCAPLVDQAAFCQEGGGLLLELGPLGAPEVRSLFTAAGLPEPAGPGDPWWEHAARISRGSPWLLRRVLDELRREPGKMTAAQLRAAFAEGMETARSELAGQTVARLARAPLTLLRGLLVCRGLVPVDRVAALVGLDASELPGALRELRAQGLIDRGDPPRPVLAERTASVLAGMPAEARARLRADAARWAHRCDAAEEDVATLLLSTGPLGDPWVPSVLRRAARLRLVRGRPAEAAELLERALREPLTGAERAEVLLEAAEAYAVTAPEAAQVRIGELLSGAPPGPRLRAAATDLVLARGEPVYTPAAPVLSYDADHARPALAPCADGGDRTADLLRWANGASWDDIARPGRPAGGGSRAGERPVRDGSPVGQSRPRRVRPAGEPATGGAAHGTLAALAYGTAEPGFDPAALAADAWRQAMRGHDAAAVREMGLRVLRAPLDGPLFPRFTAACVLSLADAHSAARDALDAALAEAGKRASPTVVATGLLLRARLNLRACDPETAERDLAACRSLAPPHVWHPTRLTELRAAQIRVLIARERFAEADLLAAEELPPGAEEGSAWTELLYSRAQLMLCRGRPRQALAEAEECGRRLSARDWRNPALLAWRSLAALAHLGCGDEDRAAELFAEELRLAERWGTESALAWTELRRGLASPAPQAARLTERALRRLGRTPAARRFAQTLVARETAGLHPPARTDVPASAVRRLSDHARAT
ncbi:ATP-binding protein [Streptomyces sp. NBC_00557]|uniref:ATP-binding protein n=1 Tax=Streptomyces sp. NBC_00557 TaxID=2975776 RepID=UPI002E8191F9|nr:ATP-binding protein [Streptomyces sp. NBC_00557]WUC33004.1 ATP-binding protein [Streptomyces sp. NBC_00557]